MVGAIPQIMAMARAPPWSQRLMTEARASEVAPGLGLHLPAGAAGRNPSVGMALVPIPHTAPSDEPRLGSHLATFLESRLASPVAQQPHSQGESLGRRACQRAV